MDLIKASGKAYEIAKKRGQYEGDGKDVIRALKHCAGEIIEANEAYNNWTFCDIEAVLKQQFEDEIADIVMCCLSICGAERINLEKALERVFEKNEKRARGKK